MKNMINELKDDICMMIELSSEISGLKRDVFWRNDMNSGFYDPKMVRTMNHKINCDLGILHGLKKKWGIF